MIGSFWRYGSNAIFLVGNNKTAKFLKNTKGLVATFFLETPGDLSAVLVRHDGYKTCSEKHLLEMLKFAY